MALVYSCNTQPTTSAQVWYNLKEFLKTAGWTVPQSSDGSTYNNSGDQLTSAGSGAGGFNNTSAWFYIKMPGSNRGFVFQQSATAANVTITYFGPSSVVTNTPNATTAPTSSTTNAESQAIASNVAYVGTLNRVSYWADNASPYGFGVHGWSAVGAPTFHLILESMLSGTYHPLDQDPYVIYGLGANTSVTNLNFGQFDAGVRAINVPINTVLSAWIKHNMTGASFTNHCAMPSMNMLNGNNAIASYIVFQNIASVYDNKDEEVPISYGKNYNVNSVASIIFGSMGQVTSFTNCTWKGTGNYIKLALQYRANLSTYSTAATRDRLVLGMCTVPWDGSIPLVP